MNFKSLIITGMFVVAPVAYAMDEQNQVEVIEVVRYEQEVPPAEPKISNLTYFATHLATGALACGASLAFKEAFEKNSNDKATCFVIAACALCVAWKVPQWTDKLLGIKRQRDFIDNFGSFAIRSFVPYPLGTLTSELCIQNHH